MPYLTYSEYVNIGGTLEEAAFNRTIDRACSVIDNATHGRVSKMGETPLEVKALCRDLTEHYSKNELNVKSKSQSAGSVSESITFSEDSASAVNDLIFDYLLNVKDDNGTPLLYRGCSR